MALTVGSAEPAFRMRAAHEQVLGRFPASLRMPADLVDPLSGNAVVNGIPVEVGPA